MLYLPISDSSLGYQLRTTIGASYDDMVRRIACVFKLLNVTCTHSYACSYLLISWTEDAPPTTTESSHIAGIDDAQGSKILQPLLTVKLNNAPPELQRQSSEYQTTKSAPTSMYHNGQRAKACAATVKRSHSISWSRKSIRVPKKRNVDGATARPRRWMMEGRGHAQFGSIETDTQKKDPDKNNISWPRKVRRYIRRHMLCLSSARDPYTLSSEGTNLAPIPKTLTRPFPPPILMNKRHKRAQVKSIHFSLLSAAGQTRCDSWDWARHSSLESSSQSNTLTLASKHLHPAYGYRWQGHSEPCLRTTTQPDSMLPDQQAHSSPPIERLPPPQISAPPPSQCAAPLTTIGEGTRAQLRVPCLIVSQSSQRTTLTEDTLQESGTSISDWSSAVQLPQRSTSAPMEPQHSGGQTSDGHSRRIPKQHESSLSVGAAPLDGDQINPSSCTQHSRCIVHVAVPPHIYQACS